MTDEMIELHGNVRLSNRRFAPSPQWGMMVTRTTGPGEMAECARQLVLQPY